MNLLFQASFRKTHTAIRSVARFGGRGRETPVTYKWIFPARPDRVSRYGRPYGLILTDIGIRATRGLIRRTP
jgi:hypothetical protein